MGFGESRFDVHPKLVHALSEHANKKSYLPARGLPELCESVAHYYSTKLECPFEANQVIIGPGSKSIIYGLQMALDADVFLPTPSWVSYGPQATLLRRKYHYIPSQVSDDYALDINELDRLVESSDNPCKLLIINSPNNPTGQVLSDDFLRELAQYCREKGIWVLSDEIYFQVCHGDKPHVSIAKYYPEGTFVLGGLSKHLSIGGWRLGVGLMPNTEQGREIMKKLTIISSETWSGVAAPIQYAAIKAYELDADIEQYVNDCSSLHGIRTRYISQSLSTLGIHCTRTEGGFYIAPNFNDFAEGLRKAGVCTSVELAEYLLKHFSIATLPGIDFGIHEKTLSLRLSTSYLDIQRDFSAGRLLNLYRSEVDDKTLMSADNHPQINAALDAFSRFIDQVK